MSGAMEVSEDVESFRLRARSLGLVRRMPRTIGEL